MGLGGAVSVGVDIAPSVIPAGAAATITDIAAVFEEVSSQDPVTVAAALVVEGARGPLLPRAAVGTMPSMMVSMDRAGRIVVPKELRDLLDIGPHTDLELVVVGDGLRLTPARPVPRRVVEVDGWPVIEPGDRVSTDADVQRWRDADQR